MSVGAAPVRPTGMCRSRTLAVDHHREMRSGEPIDESSLPTAIRRAVGRVQADFRAATDIPCEWTFELASEDDQRDIVCMIWTSGGYGVTVEPDADEADAAVYLADEWSDQVCETLADRNIELARSWPPCPKAGHDHALDPELRGGQATWVCRHDRTVVAVVGELSRALRTPD